MICDCGHDSPSYVVQYRPRRRLICRLCSRPQPRETCSNPFAALTLDHVHDGQGRPLEITSLRQLRDAEKRHHFSSCVANTDSANFDKPPQTRQTDAFDAMTKEGRWLYPEVAQAMLQEMRAGGELPGM